jgi:1-acyl-sn-glycerol-3-phosphate acyltransferase
VSAVSYWLLWILFRVLGRVLLRVRVIGAEQIPKQGGLLVAANHASYLDIPLLGSNFPRRVAFLGRQDLFPILGFRWLCRWLGWIPIRHDRLSREGFHKASEMMKAGKVVVIYPEGTRTVDGKLRPGKQGIGVLVAETGCRVLPVHIAGSFEALPPDAWMIRLHRVTITFGSPIDFMADTGRYRDKEFYRHVSRTVMERIAELGHVAPPTLPSEEFQRRPAARPLNAE